jgi:hypothetical protein
MSKLTWEKEKKKWSEIKADLRGSKSNPAVLVSCTPRSSSSPLLPSSGRPPHRFCRARARWLSIIASLRTRTHKKTLLCCLWIFCGGFFLQRIFFGCGARERERERESCEERERERECLERGFDLDKRIAWYYSEIVNLLISENLGRAWN